MKLDKDILKILELIDWFINEYNFLYIKIWLEIWRIHN